MVVLMRQFTDSGRCDGAMRTFDRHRLSEISAHTWVRETLDETGRSSFAGRRCAATSRGGNSRLPARRRPAGDPPAAAGSAWFARLQPGQPMIPVRIVFSARLLGDTTLYVTKAPPQASQ